MNSPCGCRNAAQCWNNCCCHSLTERIAWARKHNVTPPAHIVAQVEAETATSCCAEKDTVSKTSCCCCQKPKPKSETKPRPVANHSIILLQALRCGGASDMMHASGIAIPLNVPAYTFDLPMVSRAIVADDHGSGVSFPPPVPPPRSLVT